MKIRNGFVSNSSSSSFLVRIVNWAPMINGKSDNFTRNITIAQENKLLKHGYRYTIINTPGKLEAIRNWDFENKFWEIFKPTKDVKEIWNKGYYLGYGIICNQDEEIEWLIKNKIPFRASIHSNYETVVFDGKIVWIFNNIGSENEFNGPDLKWEKERIKKLEKIGEIRKIKIDGKTEVETLL